MGCFPCHMSLQQEQRGPTGLLYGLLATVSLTSPGPGSASCWHVDPSAPTAGVREPGRTFQSSRSLELSRPVGGTAPRTLVSTGSGPFDPPPPPKNRI